jgi:copper oxidase (laccase) domain-containing protein
MKDPSDPTIASENREKFLIQNGYDLKTSYLVQVVYEGDNYLRYFTLDDRQIDDTTVTDAILTKDRHVALYLPLADCAGVVIWDSDRSALMLSHLGRHSIEQFGGIKSIDYYRKNTGITLENIHVFISPAAGPVNYPLYKFDSKGIQEVVYDQLIEAGISIENIVIDDRDTTTDGNLFSHSQALKDKTLDDGRHMIVASLS